MSDFPTIEVTHCPPVETGDGNWGRTYADGYAHGYYLGYLGAKSGVVAPPCPWAEEPPGWTDAAAAFVAVEPDRRTFTTQAEP